MIDDCSVCKSSCKISGITACFTHTTDGAVAEADEAAIWGFDHILTQSACSPRWYWPGSKRARECQLRSNKPLACLISGYDFPFWGIPCFFFNRGFYSTQSIGCPPDVSCFMNPNHSSTSTITPLSSTALETMLKDAAKSTDITRALGELWVKSQHPVRI